MNHAAGTIGIAASDTARYTAFQQCLMATEAPRGSHIYWALGTDVVKACNSMAETTLATGSDWLWMLGDDHIWDPQLLGRLLDHDLPVVAPIVCRKSPPFQPVISTRQIGPDLYEPIDLTGRAGIIPVEAVGSAGLLIRRSVLEAIEPPWFAWPNDHELRISEDYWFCQQVRKSGIPIHVDLDAHMGHLFPASVSAQRSDDGAWEYHFDCVDEPLLVFPIPKTEPITDTQAEVLNRAMRRRQQRAAQ